jgi:hypothetical protein
MSAPANKVSSKFGLPFQPAQTTTTSLDQVLSARTTEDMFKNAPTKTFSADSERRKATVPLVVVTQILASFTRST